MRLLLPGQQEHASSLLAGTASCVQAIRRGALPYLFGGSPEPCASCRRGDIAEFCQVRPFPVHFLPGTAHIEPGSMRPGRPPLILIILIPMPFSNRTLPLALRASAVRGCSS